MPIGFTGLSRLDPYEYGILPGEEELMWGELPPSPLGQVGQFLTGTSPAGLATQTALGALAPTLGRPAAGALGGAFTGATTGAMFGPAGAIPGAAVGGLLGLSGGKGGGRGGGAQVPVTSLMPGMGY